MSVKKLYVIGNSHMDPIWLWRLREGRSTWTNTCRSVVKIMKEFPMLRFVRSSSVCYRWIEETDPALFAEIVQLVEAGRWEIVGGWVEQSDTVITPGESLIRQAEFGQRYFQEKFGKTASIAYSVDSFGQNAGLPKILNATGFQRYVWMRPGNYEKPMPEIFRWRGDDRTSEVLSFRIQKAYCTMPSWKKPEEMYAWIDELVEKGAEHQSFFFGVGDHGGGLYREQLGWLLDAADRYPMEFSSLEHYFDCLESQNLPVVEGEHLHHAPGCYAAVSDVKCWMSDAEKALFKAEKIVLESAAPDQSAITAKLDDAWNELLFNYFHDVYPGTSIYDAYRHEVRDIAGYATKIANDVLEIGLGRYAARGKTDFLTEGGLLVWNPLPRPALSIVHCDNSGDPNYSGRCFDQVVTADGRTYPIQWGRGASDFGVFNKWGRATVALDLPAGGLEFLAYRRSADEAGTLAKVGFRRQKKLFERLGFAVMSDNYDTWAHDATSLGEVIGSAFVGRDEGIDNGPVFSTLRRYYRWKQSEWRVDLTVYASSNAVELRISGEWLEKEADLKLCFRTGIGRGKIVSGQASCVISRSSDHCEQPFIDWVAAAGRNGRMSGFVGAAFHSYDSVGTGELRLTILRPVHYAEHVPNPYRPDERYADSGYFERDELWIYEDQCDARSYAAKAQELLWHAEHFELTDVADGQGFVRDVWEIEPAELTVSAQRRTAAGQEMFHLVNPGPELDARILCNGRECWRGHLAENALAQILVEHKESDR